MKDQGGWGGIGAHEHSMNEEAQGKVIKAFAAHNIALHIDDGWMGGGGSVTHKDNIDNDFVDGNGFYRTTYFVNENPGRENIFYWCLFAHRNDPHDEPGIGSVDDEGEAVAFNLDTYGFVVFDNVLGAGFDGNWNWISHETKQACDFMHELGHTLSLDDTGNTDSAMYSPAEDTQHRGFWPMGYSTNEWNSLNFNYLNWRN